MDETTWIIKKIPATEYKASPKEIEQAVANVTEVIADMSILSDATNDDDEAAGTKGEVEDV